MLKPRLLAQLIVAVSAMVYAVPGPGARAAAQAAPPVLAESLAGRDSYELYCTACHGRGGRGDGPVGDALRIAPADLTALARLNGGVFPADRVRAFITGAERPVAAHGTSEMPAWGPIFRAFESDAEVRERVANLVSHVESLQLASSASGTEGARLFRTYCASCHGTTARGNGPMALQLRQPPADLTQFTARNGGVFPSARVYRIIDGRDVPQHGEPEMPVWGDAFRALQGGLTEEAVKSRIEAIVRYLEAIQERAAE